MGLGFQVRNDQLNFLDKAGMNVMCNILMESQKFMRHLAVIYLYIWVSVTFVCDFFLPANYQQKGGVLPSIVLVDVYWSRLHQAIPTYQDKEHVSLQWSFCSTAMLLWTYFISRNYRTWTWNYSTLLWNPLCILIWTWRTLCMQTSCSAVKMLTFFIIYVQNLHHVKVNFMLWH